MKVQVSNLRRVFSRWCALHGIEGVMLFALSSLLAAECWKDGDHGGAVAWIVCAGLWIGMAIVNVVRAGQQLQFEAMRAEALAAHAEFEQLYGADIERLFPQLRTGEAIKPAYVFLARMIREEQFAVQPTIVADQDAEWN